MSLKKLFFASFLNKRGISIYLSIMKAEKGRRKKILFLINGIKKNPQISS